MNKIKLRANRFGIISGGMSKAYFGGGSNKVKTVDPLAGTGLRDLYKQLSGWIGPQIGQGITPYGGEMVPGASPLQQMGFDAAGGLPPIATGGQQYFQDVLGQADPSAPGKFQEMAGGTLQGLMEPFDPASATKFWEQSWKGPALETWEQDIVPGIKEHYASRDAADSGAMNRQLARSGQRLGTDLSAQLANLLYSGEQAQMGRQQTGVGQAAQLAQLPGNVLQQAGQVGGMGMDTLSQLLNIGGVQRGITGEQMQEPYQKWQTSQPYNNPYLQNFLGATLSQPGLTPYMSQQAPGFGQQMLPGLGSFLGTEAGAGSITGLLSGLFGGGAGAGAAATPMAAGLTGALGPQIGGMSGLLLGMSDVRMKENFARIENALEKVNQLEGHTYNFIGQDERSGGLIAQQLEKVLPEAVTERQGIKYVKLDAVIGLLINAVKELSEKIKETS